MYTAKEGIKVTGSLIIKKYDSDGELVQETSHKNLVVETGKVLIASRLYANTRPAITTTSGSANGTSATLNFAAQSAAPYEVGNTITVSGVIPTAFNGTHRVISSTTSSVTFELSSSVLTVTTNGQIDSLFNGTIKTMRVGFGSTAANISDVQLIDEKGSASLYSSGIGLEQDEVYVSYIALFPAGTATTPVGSVIQEAGLFNESNKMLCRTVFPPITKLAGESLEIFWKLTIA